MIVTGSHEPLTPLPPLMVEPAVRAALLEDLGTAGDITSAAVVPADIRASVRVATRQAGILAGLDCAMAAFRLVDPDIKVTVVRADGSRIAAGETVAHVRGPARSILTAERVALNFLCHLSGVATATAGLVQAVRGYRARITCTRKTTPGLRALEKQAVRAGGGINHRFGLHDGILIKDNHIAAAGGIAGAVERARGAIGHMVKIEVEVDTLAQLEAALAAGVDAVLLDNMEPAVLVDAVKLVAGRAISEASGRITAASAPAIAAAGVDLISAGWITHSAPALDLGLDFDTA